MTARANEALVRRAIEAIWNRGELDVADELFESNYVNHDGLIADLVRGPEAIKVSAVLHRLAFPGLHVTVEELNTVDDTVVCRWAARRESTGRSSAGAPSNLKSLSGITRSRFADGKIVESWTDWDQTGVLRDLGVARTE